MPLALKLLATCARQSSRSNVEYRLHPEHFRHMDSLVTSLQAYLQRLAGFYRCGVTLVGERSWRTTNTQAGSAMILQMPLLKWCATDGVQYPHPLGSHAYRHFSTPTWCPISHVPWQRDCNCRFVNAVSKVKANEPQKLQENRYHQCANLDGAFEVAHDVLPGPVLLLDDVFDSGWTMTVVAALLRPAGVAAVWPVALAAATAGD